MTRRRSNWLGVAILVGTGIVMTWTHGDPAFAGDPAAAERQYRIARRLAAEDSPQAADALQRVIELDPTGSLADDASLDLAMLLDIPGWPGELGRLARADRDRAIALLDRLLQDVPGGDRATEASYRRALLNMEPLPGQDRPGARLDLLAVATNPESGEWGLRARVAIAWLDEQSGRTSQARAGCQRLMIDRPGTPAAQRARFWLVRLDLYEGRFGEAAALLQHMVDDGESLLPELALALRELAVRGALRDANAGGTWAASKPVAGGPTGVRSLRGIERVIEGPTLVADGKRGNIVVIDAIGQAGPGWSVEDPSALEVDPLGRIWVAAGDKLYRLEAGGPVAVASLGKAGPAGGLAADSAGNAWIIERRGDRIVKIGPGGSGPETVWESGGDKISALAWDGRRLIAADYKAGRLLEIGSDGVAKPIGDVVLQRPESIATDLAGQIAVLEGKTDDVVLIGPDGVERDRINAKAIGVTKPAGVALGTDGSLVVFNEAGGNLTRVP